jgi:hypothetical protein
VRQIINTPIAQITCRYIDGENGLAFDFLHRRLGYGDLPVHIAGAGETKH